VERMLEWENAGKIDLLRVGYSLRAPELLFRKIEQTEVDQQKEKLVKNSLNSSIAASTPEPTGKGIASKPEINFDDFAKIELRTGIILQAEKVQKADKLLKLEIDLGFEKRTVVSGIAQHYEPEAIIGKQVTVVVNLAPRKMRGIESAGMILMAEDAEGRLSFVTPENPVPPGSEVR